MQIGFGVVMFVLGAVIGSFLCCQARRIELKERKKQSLGRRSVCMNCKKQLTWYENIPIISWIIQGGRCRKCKKKIGIGELLSELGMAAALACASTTIDVSTTNPLDWATLVAVILFVSSLGFLAIYDGLYGELPNKALFVSFLLSLAVVVTLEWGNTDFSYLLGIALSIAVLGGPYFLLYLISRGKWVGDGDWILGSIIAIALGTPWLALVALFLSNFIACLVMYPFVKGKNKKQIYFGPFLVIAYVITITFSVLIESMVI